MNLALWLMQLNLWLMRAAVLLVIVAALLAAVRTRTPHSFLLAAAICLLALGSWTHWLATPTFTIEDQQALIRGEPIVHTLAEPLETVSKLCFTSGLICASLGAISLIRCYLPARLLPASHTRGPSGVP